MRENPVKRRLRDGGVAVGTFVFEFATTGIARLAAGADSTTRTSFGRCGLW